VISIRSRRRPHAATHSRQTAGVPLGAMAAPVSRRQKYRLSYVPEGDIVVGGGDAVRYVAVLSRAIECADGWLRRGPVAMRSFVGFAILVVLAVPP
jgi:hypothetical protein